MLVNNIHRKMPLRPITGFMLINNWIVPYSGWYEIHLVGSGGTGGTGGPDGGSSKVYTGGSGGGGGSGGHTWGKYFLLKGQVISFSANTFGELNDPIYLKVTSGTAGGTGGAAQATSSGVIGTPGVGGSVTSQGNLGSEDGNPGDGRFGGAGPYGLLTSLGTGGYGGLGANRWYDEIDSVYRIISAQNGAAGDSGGVYLLLLE